MDLNLKKKRQLRYPHSLLQSHLLVWGAKKTVAAEEMLREGEDRDILAEPVQIAMSPI